MIRNATQWFSRWTPQILLIVFVLVLLNAIVRGAPFVRDLFYASWLLVAAAAFVRFDDYLDHRK